MTGKSLNDNIMSILSTSVPLHVIIAEAVYSREEALLGGLQIIISSSKSRQHKVFH